jgi:hypothetical protein
MGEELALHPALVAGALSGIAGLLVFLVIHAVWITPIWFILPMGLVLAIVGGLAAGWAYVELLPYLPVRPWTALALMGLICLILAPALALAEVRQPLFNVTPAGSTLAVTVPVAAARFVLELLLTAGLAGGLAGWWLGRTPQAALATALAGLTFALGPGHNIPFIGGTSGVGKELALMGAIIAVAAVVLVEAHAWLATGRPPGG